MSALLLGEESQGRQERRTEHRSLSVSVIFHTISESGLSGLGAGYKRHPLQGTVERAGSVINGRSGPRSFKSRGAKAVDNTGYVAGTESCPHFHGQLRID